LMGLTVAQWFSRKEKPTLTAMADGRVEDHKQASAEEKGKISILRTQTRGKAGWAHEGKPAKKKSRMG